MFLNINRRRELLIVLLVLSSIANVFLLLNSSIFTDGDEVKITNHSVSEDDDTLSRLKTIDFGNSGRLDKTLQYKYFDDVFLGTKVNELNKIHHVCLATQSSLDRILSLLEIVDHWSGAISVAVFESEITHFVNLLNVLIYLRKCFPKIREQVTFHFVTSSSTNLEHVGLNTGALQEQSCDKEAINMLRKLLRFNRTVEFIYPQNHLRNLARKHCLNGFVFSTDIDVIPSYGMLEKLDEFLMKFQCKNGLCAFVVPTFEIDESLSFPLSKMELLNAINRNLARPFHQQFFKPGHFATNYEKWYTIKDSDSYVTVSHEFDKFNFFYEPFYVAEDTVPPYEERFIGYGFTRNTQTYEMLLAGYKFFVLSPIFTVHWGLLSSESRPQWREAQIAKNVKKFNKYKKEILVKYKEGG